MTTSLGGEPARRSRVQVPAWGAPWIDVELTEPAELSGAQTFSLAGVSIETTVVSGGVFDGKARYRCVAGKAGWGKTLPPGAPYLDDAGVKVSRVLQDLANECGETLGTLPTSVRGPHYSRPGQPAYITLNELAPRAWYIDFDGVTQFGQRPTVVYSGDAPRTRIDKGARVIELALDELDPIFVPGVVVDGMPPATDVEYEIDEKRLTVRVYWGAPLRSRRFDAITQIIEGLFPNLRFAGTFEYRVVTQSGERLNLQIVRVSTGMSDLSNVFICPGVSGFRSDVTLGEIVKVAFADRDPSRPYVFAHDHADAEGWLPTVSEIGTETDFLATKTAIDTLQERFDTFLSSEYDVHVHPTGVGPSGPHGAVSETVGALPATDLLKASTDA